MNTQSSRPVVVGYDGSAAGDSALSWAAREAARRNATLHVVVATGVPFATAPGFGAAWPWPDDLDDALLTQAKERLGDSTEGIPVVTESTIGTPASVLVEASKWAEIVVVGRRRHTVIGEFVGGSTSAQVAAHAACPVVVVEDGKPGAPDGQIIVGVDGSEPNESAIALAFDWASSVGAPVVLVHAWALDVPVSFEAAQLSQAIVEEVEERQRVFLDETVLAWSAKYPEVDVRSVLSRDRTVPAMLAEAKGAQLLVVGSRGHGGFVGLLLGSVSQGLIHHERPCPLVVVHAEQVGSR
ncbi:universal stress protein [Knoellia sinensis KCTC 19936]|uniref:Universal stress protein n=1 Tax=Knoellia sinensis KCTC 19936 TaxID=1385520 RepID=A0A0A0J932_9MICO|nr:universal stress protein [Knoellia sinensis]KGN33289.1 universal stress protein [Knoellia sinensis KCTC 19936]